MLITKPDLEHLTDTLYKNTETSMLSTIDVYGNHIAVGYDDSTIKIFDKASLLTNATTTPQSLNYHHNSVMFVRFIDSNTLVSGSIDGMIAVWNNSNNFQVVGTVSNPFQVDDLSVSLDKSKIAVCTIKGNCNIYKMAKSPILISSIHCDFPIKSVCFDPLMQFIAILTTKELEIYDITQLDQPQKSKSIKKMIDKSVELFSLKLSYSPDGQQLAVPNCMNSKLPVCTIFNREMEETHLFGHSSSIAIASFSPKLYNRSSINQSTCSILALACNDGSISIWMSCNFQPWVVISESLFDDSITELSWHNDGLLLIASSLDGTLALFSFTAAEFGNPLSEDEATHFLAKQGISKVSSAPISQLEIELQQKKIPIVEKVPINTKTVTPNTTIVSTVSATPTTALNAPVVSQQTETRDKNGKRKITPKTISAVPSNAKNPDLVPIYDIVLKSDDKLILTPIKEQLEIEHKQNKYKVVNNAPEKHFSELRVHGPSIEFKRIIESEAIQYITAINDYILCISIHHELQIFSLSLRQIALPILFDSQVFCICTKDNLFAVLTQLGIIQVFHVEHGLKLIQECAIGPVLRKETIKRIELTSSYDIELITNKATYTFNKLLKKWAKKSASNFEILNDRYQIQNEKQVFSILNAQSNMRSAATRQYFEVLLTNIETIAAY